MPPGPWPTQLPMPEMPELELEDAVVDVEDVEVDVCAVAARMDGDARRIAMMPMADAVTIAVFANLVVMFKVDVKAAGIYMNS